MNGSRKKPLVWGGWPMVGNRPRPDSQSTDDAVSITHDEEYQNPAIEKVAIEADKSLLESDVATLEKLGSQSGASGDDYGANSEEIMVNDHVQAMEEDASPARPRPPAPSMGPYYPPGPVYPNYELARAYVPIQKFGPTYSLPEALDKGTLFPELWRPYPR